MDLAEESFLAELIMSRRLDFNKDFRNRQARYGLSVKDEAEWIENDAAARWLQKNENRALRKEDHRLSDQQDVFWNEIIAPKTFKAETCSY
jgi:hypothetical protein